MKLPHHLILVASTYHFRLKTPKDLVGSYGKKYLKHSLDTGDVVKAKEAAYILTSSYLNQFQKLRAMARDPKEEAARLVAARASMEAMFKKAASQSAHEPESGSEGLPDGVINKFEVEALQLPNGEILWRPNKTTSPEDEAAGQREADFRNLHKLKPNSAPVQVPSPHQANGGYGVRSGELLSEAIKWFDIVFRNSNKNLDKKTVDKYIKTLIEYNNFIGDCELASIGRGEIRRYVHHLEIDCQPATIKNKVSPLIIFFKELKKSNKYIGDNPAVDQYNYSSNEKRIVTRTKGKLPFNEEHLNAIFNKDNYKNNLEPAEYWAPIVQLYTGTRANEICQLMVSDFVIIQGFKCFIIVDEELELLIKKHKSTKEESSRRIVPIHNDLLDIGFWDYMERVKAMGHSQLFPELRSGANKFSSKQIKSFVAYMNSIGISTMGGRLATHSFRKHLVQYLQAKKVDRELRKIYVGHSKDDLLEEAFDIHSNIYEFEKRAKEVSEGILENITFDFGISKLKRDFQEFDRFLTKEYMQKRNAEFSERQGRAKKGLEKNDFKYK